MSNYFDSKITIRRAIVIYIIIMICLSLGKTVIQINVEKINRHIAIENIATVKKNALFTEWQFRKNSMREHSVDEWLSLSEIEKIVLIDEYASLRDTRDVWVSLNILSELDNDHYIPSPWPSSSN